MLAGLAVPATPANAQEPAAAQESPAAQAAPAPTPPGSPPNPEAVLACANRSDARDNASLDRQIAGCTTIVESENQATENLAFALHNRGNAYRNKEQFDRAITDYDAAIKLNASSGLAFVNRGAAHQGKGAVDRAMEDYNRGIELDPSLALAFFARGTLNLMTNRFDQAVADFDKGIKLDATEPHAFNNRGTAYLSIGQYDRAVRDYDQALKLNPQLASALGNRCWIHAFAYRDLPRALVDCDESLRLQPDAPNVARTRALVGLKLETLGKAVADFSAAIQLNARDARALYGRGLARIKSGDNGGQADLAAARKIRNDIADFYAKQYGVTP
jgi:tetratricopeptide (TPR) repeat protein